MSHWAEVDKNNTVVRVLVGDNNDVAGDEGYLWLIKNFGGTWIKTSYNANFKYNYASIGYIYDPVDDAFIAPMPNCGHDGLLLNEFKRWKCANAEHDIKLS